MRTSNSNSTGIVLTRGVVSITMKQRMQRRVRAVGWWWGFLSSLVNSEENNIALAVDLCVQYLSIAMFTECLQSQSGRFMQVAVAVAACTDERCDAIFHADEIYWCSDFGIFGYIDPEYMQMLILLVAFHALGEGSHFSNSSVLEVRLCDGSGNQYQVESQKTIHQ